MADGANDPIVQELEVSAERDAVFRALTEAPEIERWWATRASSDPKPGGRFHYEWEFPDAPERNHVQSGTYDALEDGDSVAYPWKVGPATTKVRFTFAGPASGPTRVRLEHTGWTAPLDDARGNHEQGWRMFLGNLKSVLEDGDDKRAAMTGMRVLSGSTERR